MLSPVALCSSLRCQVTMTDSVDASQGNGEAILSVTKSKPVILCPAMKTYDGLYYLSHVDETLMEPLDVLFSFEMDGKRMTEDLYETIKQALSNVLVHFYPFAGSLIQDPDGKFMVKCTGEGVSFVEAVANCDLNEFGDFTVPDLPKHRQLVNVCDEAKNPFDIPLLAVQVTRFQCGSFVLGISVNHCMCDATSLMAFMKSWSELARGLPLSVPPFLDRSILQPRQPLNHGNISVMNKNGSKFSVVHRDEQFVFKSFCFDAQKLIRLRKIAMEDGTIKSATDFELIMAFIWCARTKALKMNPADPSNLLIVVDGRNRLGPSLPKGYFGNAIFPTGCECNAGELIGRPLSFAVDLMKRAIDGLNHIQSLNDYIEATNTKIQVGKGFVGNKWSGLSSNDIDFGWGGPKQYSNASPHKEAIIYVYAQSKDSKNKILTLGLPPSDMKAFEEIMQSDLGMQALI